MKIDLDSQQVSIQDQTVCVSLISTKSGFARTRKGICIPANSEVNVMLKLSKCQENATVLLEPLPTLNNIDIAGARCLVTVHKSRAPIRLMNPTSEDVYLKGHKVIATVNEVDLSHVHILADDSAVGAKVSACEKPDRQTQGEQDKEGKNDFNISGADLTDSQKGELLKFLESNQDIFSNSLKDLGETNLFKHRIETEPGAPPVHLRPYRQAPPVRDKIEEMVEEMLEDGIIDQSNSVWHSPVILVKKKGNNQFRFAVDYRSLNKITISISHPLPRLECVFDTVGQSKAQLLQLWISLQDFGKCQWILKRNTKLHSLHLQESMSGVACPLASKMDPCPFKCLWDKF